LRTRTRLFTARRLFAFIAVAACEMALAAHGQAQNPPPRPPSRTSTASHATASTEMPLVNLEGYKKLLADHRGKPLLVTFWATWCEPCRDEYPLVNELAKQYAAQGLVVVGVDMDDDAELGRAQRFIEKNQPVFPNVRKKMGHEDEFVDGVDPRWHDTMPANFFYAADGRLIGFMTGGRPRSDFDQMIQATLAASPRAASHP
jgi:thiol-disulfide isomerase/thioredoxin